MKLHFIASFNVSDYVNHGVMKMENIFLVRYLDAYSEKVRKELRKMAKKNEERTVQGREPVELEIDADIHYTKRSLSWNRWMWAMHNLEANLLNAAKFRNLRGIKWHDVDAITPEMIHEADMEQYAPRATVDVAPNEVPYITESLEADAGRVVSKTPIGDKVRIELWKTTRYWDVKKATEYGDILKDRLLSYGVDIEHAGDFSGLMKDLEKLRSAE